MAKDSKSVEFSNNDEKKFNWNEIWLHVTMTVFEIAAEVQICLFFFFFFASMWWKIMECLCCTHVIFIRQGHQGTVNKQKANFHFIPSCIQISDKLILVTKIAQLCGEDKTKHNFSFRTRMGLEPRVKD